MQLSEAVQQIQQVLAPAVMISSSALLAMGLQNKLTALANRFRALTHEKRALNQNSGRTPVENERLNNLTEQTSGLLKRIKLVKQSIVCVFGSILCFTGTSLAIFANLISHIDFWKAGIFLFGAGFIFVFIASALMIRETLLLYRIIKLEHFS